MEYVWFFVAFLAGWAVRVIIGNLSGLIKEREQARLYMPTTLWNVFLLALIIEMWIAAPDLGANRVETGTFLLFLLLPMAANLMAYLVEPNFKEEPDEAEPEAPELSEAVDSTSGETAAPAGAATAVAVATDTRPLLQRQFDRNRVFFFSIMLALPVVSVLREFIANEGVALNADFWFRMLVAAGALVGLAIRGRRADTILAVVMVVVIIAYTLIVFPYVTA